MILVVIFQIAAEMSFPAKTMDVPKIRQGKGRCVYRGFPKEQSRETLLSAFRPSVRVHSQLAPSGVLMESLLAVLGIARGFFHCPSSGPLMKSKL